MHWLYWIVISLPFGSMGWVAFRHCIHYLATNDHRLADGTGSSASIFQP